MLLQRSSSLWRDLLLRKKERKKMGKTRHGLEKQGWFRTAAGGRTTKWKVRCASAAETGARSLGLSQLLSEM